ncbi:acyltransferase [Mucilaginibacter sp. SG564]|uniref:acyltransferase n=1 Tax=Mucilaginibacter sp. SG564 TaxID=2587022 RepID=UPI001552213A|nr:acyltransferase family protein [Mucilaginibacter sp. SG564]NOW93589.1 surface polysaccharide O-acyltransferase-like enzyme [Mucilaginibacter sp. SG564]
MTFNQDNTQDTPQNITWINNLRLIAMFAVVILHTASPLLFYHKGNSMKDWLVADIYNALVRFAVPVFVMITGALLLHRDYELGDFLKKRLSRLILPFLFWSTVYILYRCYNEEFVFTDDIWANTKLILLQFQTGAYYHLWYVYLLIGLYLFIPILGKFVRHASEKELLYFLCIWFLTVLISKPYLSSFDTAIDLHNFTGYIGYLILGYYLTYKNFHIRGLVYIAAATFLVTALIIIAGTHYLLLKNHEISTFFYEPISPFIILLSASAFLTAKHTVVRLSPALNKIAQNAGKFTLGIYFSHALILTLFDLTDINYTIFNPIFSIPVIALSCFLLSWLLVYIMSKIPFIKHLVG